MTPRAEAWLRQADNHLAMAGYALDGGIHTQACHPDGDQPPSELFDRVDAQAAVVTAKAVLAFVSSLSG
jgi:HEPN domain-containing protein